MSEMTLSDAAFEYDILQNKLTKIYSLAFMLMLAAKSGTDAEELSGALYLLSETTQGLAKEMKAVNKKIYETLENNKKENEKIHTVSH